MDPYRILGVRPGVSEGDLAAAYRDLAKEWHPDRRGAAGAERMAEINVAYELLRAGTARNGAPVPSPPTAARPRRGAWLTAAFRRALGPELLEALGEGEPVRLVTPASTWASPRTILAVTDRRLLWLLDDAPVARVRFLAFRDVAEVEHRLRRPRKRVASLHLRTIGGRRYSFSELRPPTAAAIERHVRGRA